MELGGRAELDLSFHVPAIDPATPLELVLRVSKGGEPRFEEVKASRIVGRGDAAGVGAADPDSRGPGGHAADGEAGALTASPATS